MCHLYPRYCPERCVNANGVSECLCESGYRKRYVNEGNDTCEDIDECESWGRCFYVLNCINYTGGFICAPVAIVFAVLCISGVILLKRRVDPEGTSGFWDYVPCCRPRPAESEAAAKKALEAATPPLESVTVERM